ncbi:hypothetical protein [Shewanella zhuhaiensis]|uniref:hypothetical protein n=1 Tax=Shewanella zhuhaiensis TaxID=2919576 RepID=UPI001F0BB9BC|nr:hypothetical protein [Shewanella zhuhaiensis]
MVLLLGVGVCSASDASIFQCTEGDRVVFQDVPCAGTEGEEIVLAGKKPRERSIVYLPFQHIGQPLTAVANRYGLQANAAGNLVHMDDGIEILLESELDLVSYAEIRFGLHTCKQESLSQRDAARYLKLIGIDEADLKLRIVVAGPDHIRTYDDYDHRLKVSVFCPYSGGEWSVGFSPKGYKAG